MDGSDSHRKAPIKILVIEDQPDLREILGAGLRTEGYTVLLAEDGDAGLALARDEQPDLVLLDVVMPGIDGFEVCSELTADDRTRCIPVIFITAMAQVENIVQGLERGAQDYITKPFDMREVKARVKATLRSRRMTEPLSLGAPLTPPGQSGGDGFDKLLGRLTDKEVAVLRLICLGQSNKDIAQALGVSPFTVKNHISNIFRKLNTTSRTEAARIGILSRLI